MSPNIEAAKAIQPKPCPMCGIDPDQSHSAGWLNTGNLRKSWRVFCGDCKLTTQSSDDLRSAVIEWNGAIMRAMK